MTYARQRLGGIEIRPLSEGELAGNQSITAREEKLLPRLLRSRSRAQFGGAGGFAAAAVYATGPLSYVGQAATQRDIDYMKAAMQGATASTEGFLSSLAPGTIEHWLRNEHYKTDEEFVFAIADAMHEEYKAIADAGLIVQLDDPGLPDGFMIHPDMSMAEYRKFLEVRVEATNHAIRDIPEEQVRLHMCWGSFHHPHTQDLPLKEIIDLVYKVKAQCYSHRGGEPAARARVGGLQVDHPLPDGKILMPGILGHCAARVRRAPRGRGAAPRALRQRRRQRERDRRHGLRPEPASRTPRSCGRSSRRCPTALRSPRSGCGGDRGVRP